MPEWISTLLSKWPDLVIVLIGTCIGAAMGFAFSMRVIRIQDQNIMNKKKKIYLANLLNEFEYDLEILRRIRSFIVPGPDIDHIWAPAKANADFLKTNAWTELILAGVLESIDDSTICHFQLASQTILDVKRILNESIENRFRDKEWKKLDKATGSQQLVQGPTFMNYAINEICGRVDYSITELDKSILLIKEIMKTRELIS